MEKDILISKYLSGELSEKENALLKERLRQDAQFNTEFEQSVLIWENSKELPIEVVFDTENALSQVKQTLFESKLKPYLFQKIFKNVYTWQAAALILLSTLICLWYFKTQNQPYADEVAYVEYIKSKDEMIVGKYLKDSTKIYIGKNSKLWISTDFGKKTRKVKLQGEAFFDVRHDTSQAFIVDIGKERLVQVLGTSFGIHTHYNGGIYVWVRTGKVRCTFDTTHVVLTANQKIWFDTIHHVLQTNPKPIKSYISYQLTNTFQFTNTELYKVIEILSNYYQVNIHIGSERLKYVRLTATFTDLDIVSALDIIKITLGLQVVKNGNEYVLYE